MSEPKTIQNPEELSFEAAMARLEAVVKAMEGDNLSLDESLSLYEEGVALTRRLNRELTEAELWAYSREALRYIRNELLARHGYAYGSTNKFARYFKSKDWYKSGGYENAILTALEWDNINLIRTVERKMDILETENESGLDIEEIIMYQNGGVLPNWYKK